MQCWLFNYITSCHCRGLRPWWLLGFSYSLAVAHSNLVYWLLESFSLTNIIVLNIGVSGWSLVARVTCEMRLDDLTIPSSPKFYEIYRAAICSFLKYQAFNPPLLQNAYCLSEATGQCNFWWGLKDELHPLCLQQWKCKCCCPLILIPNFRTLDFTN